MRLLPGWLAGQAGRAFELDGDESIRRRPVDRIAEPLRLMGAEIEARDGGLPPFTVHGARLQASATSCPSPARRSSRACCSPGCSPSGETTVVEPEPSRDHTERLLAQANVADRPRGRRDHACAAPTSWRCPRSASSPPTRRSAAFADRRRACSSTGSRLTITRLRRQLDAHRLPADPRADGRRSSLGDLERRPGDGIPACEPISDIDVRSGPLCGTVVEPDEVPLAIDELPLVALLGCFAEGETVVRGARELRLKESDRIATVVDGLNAPRRRHRGDRRRLRRARHRRAAGRQHRLRRRPSPGDARRRRGPRLARGRRGSRHGRRGGLVPGLPRGPRHAAMMWTGRSGPTMPDPRPESPRSHRPAAGRASRARAPARRARRGAAALAARRAVHRRPRKAAGAPPDDPAPGAPRDRRDLPLAARAERRLRARHRAARAVHARPVQPVLPRSRSQKGNVARDRQRGRDDRRPASRSPSTTSRRARTRPRRSTTSRRRSRPSSTPTS